MYTLVNPSFTFQCGSSGVVLCCLFLEVRVSVTFRLTSNRIVFCSVWDAVRAPLGEKLLTRLTICSLRVFIICDLSYFLFWF